MTDPTLPDLVQAVLAAPDDASAQRRLAGRLRRGADLGVEGLGDAVGLLLESDHVKVEHLGLIAERMLVERYGLDGDTLPDVERLADDRLFGHLLTKAFVRAPVVEAFCRRLRATLLRADAPPAGLVGALAVQAFNNEYLFDASEDEMLRVESLAGSASPLDRLKAAMYRRVDPPSEGYGQPAQRVLVDEPAEERRLATQIASFGSIADDTSVLVRAQYEEHPFPRWLSIGSGMQPLAKRFPDGVVAPENRFPGRPLRILVPGCGTGQHPLSLALGNPEASVLGVDISRASLAYAQRKASEAGVGNIDLLHADLLELPELGRTFDHIDCVGVLHHLGDPMAGWRALVDVLEPGGTLHVGVYGKAARLPVTYVRDEVARLGIEPTDEAMRAYRQKLLTAGGRYAALLSSVRGGINTMSHLRDTLFHASEYQYTLGEIEQTVETLGLRLLWAELRGPLKARYLERYGNEPLTGFDRWREIEAWYAGSLRMFEFWVEKPG